MGRNARDVNDRRWRLAHSMILYCLPDKAWALGLSYHRTSSLNPGLYPGLLTLRSWRLPDAPVKQQWSFQHRDAEESEILLSGFSVPLWLYPRTSSQDTHASVAEGDTSSPDDRHRLSSAERATVGGRSCRSPAAGFCARTRTSRHKKKESTSMRLTPESGGYLLSRNSVPSAIASLTSLFGMGRGGTSLP